MSRLSDQLNNLSTGKSDPIGTDGEIIFEKNLIFSSDLDTEPFELERLIVSDEEDDDDDDDDDEEDEFGLPFLDNYK